MRQVTESLAPDLHFPFLSNPVCEESPVPGPGQELERRRHEEYVVTSYWKHLVTTKTTFCNCIFCLDIVYSIRFYKIFIPIYIDMAENQKLLNVLFQM